MKAGYIDDDGHYQGLTRAECQALLSLEATGQPVTVDIGSLGSYRVLATKDAETGDTVITGLSMKTDNALVRAQLLIEGPSPSPALSSWRWPAASWCAPPWRP